MNGWPEQDGPRSALAAMAWVLLAVVIGVVFVTALALMPWAF